MSKKLKLTKLEFESESGQKIALSLAEARELYAQLHEIFGEKPEYLPLRPAPSAPLSPWRIPHPQWPAPVITCGASSSAASWAI